MGLVLETIVDESPAVTDLYGRGLLSKRQRAAAKAWRGDYHTGMTKSGKHKAKRESGGNPNAEQARRRYNEMVYRFWKRRDSIDEWMRGDTPLRYLCIEERSPEEMADKWGLFPEQLINLCQCALDEVAQFYELDEEGQAL